MSRSASFADATNVPPDADLVQAALAGQQTAFGKLVERHKRSVYALVCLETGSLQESQEIAHDSFVVAWRKLSRLERPDRFRSWVHTIALNLCRDRARDFMSRWSSVTVDVDVASAEPSPLERIISREQEVMLAQALTRVPKVYRVPLVLFHKQQRPILRIARTLGVSVPTVKLRLARGRTLLRENLLALVESGKTRVEPHKGFTAGILLAISGTAAPVDAASCSPGLGARPLGKARTLGRIAALVAPVMGGALALLIQAGVSRTESGPPEPWRSATAAAREVVQAGLMAAAPVRARESPGLDHSGPSGETAVVSYDFEDGVQSDEYLAGQVVEGPCRTAGDRCMAGTIDTLRRYWAILAPASFHYTEGQVLTFDYLAGPHNRSLLVQVNNRRRNVVSTRIKLVSNRWSSARVRLSDLIPVPGHTAFLTEGDRIAKIKFCGGLAGHETFHIDNVRIVRD